MGEMILTFIGTLIGLALTPSIADQVFAVLHNSTGTGASNVTGISAALLSPLLVIFWVMLVMAVPIVQVYRWYTALQKGG